MQLRKATSQDLTQSNTFILAGIDTHKIPVRMLVYPERLYKSVLYGHVEEWMIDEMIKNDECVPLDKTYLSLAIKDGRLFLNHSNNSGEAKLNYTVDVRAEIKALYDKAVRADYKMMSVWFKYLELMDKNKLKHEIKYIDYMAKLLKYSDGWAYYKKLELNLIKKK